MKRMRPIERVAYVASLFVLFIVGMSVGRAVEQPEVIVREQVDTLVLSASDYRDYLVSLEARRAGVPVQLALAISHAENWSGDPDAISSAGAIGIMQVMPYDRKGKPLWIHAWLEECYGDLSLNDPRRNACVGVRVLKDYHEKNGSWDLAVRDYNGALALKRAGDNYIISVFKELIFNSLPELTQ